MCQFRGHVTNLLTNGNVGETVNKKKIKKGSYQDEDEDHNYYQPCEIQ